MKTTHLISVVIFSLHVALEANADPEKVPVNPVLSGLLLAKERVDKEPLDERDDEVFNSWDYALSTSDSEGGKWGVVSLWIKGKRALVELAWWRQRDPEVRKCILLLYYSLTKIEADNFPSFELFATRFAKEEADARKGEIEEVKKIAAANRPALQRAFPTR